MIASMPEALATAQSIAAELQYECLVIRTNQQGYGQVVAVVESGGQVRDVTGPGDGSSPAARWACSNPASLG